MKLLTSSIQIPDILSTNYITLAIFVLSVIVGYKIYKRMVANGVSYLKKYPIFKIGYVILIYLIINTFAIPFFFSSVVGLYKMFTLESYESEVISVDSYWDEDSDGNSVKMYTPTLQANIPNVGVKVSKSDVSSSSTYEIGEKIKVVYDAENDKLINRSLSSILLSFGGFLLSLVLFSFSVFGILYAFYLTKMQPTSFVVLLFMYIIFPIGMIGLASGLGYYIYERIFNDYKSDQPIWVLILCIFFFMILVLAFFGFLKTLFSKSKTTEELIDEELDLDYENVPYNVKQKAFFNEYEELSWKLEDLLDVLDYVQEDSLIENILPQIRIEFSDEYLQFEEIQLLGSFYSDKNSDKEKIKNYLKELKDKDWHQIIQENEFYDDEIGEYFSDFTNQEIYEQLSFVMDID